MQSAYYPAGTHDSDDHFNVPSVNDSPEWIETTKPCPECKGECQVEYESVTLNFFNPFSHSVETCQTCHGAGEVATVECSACGAPYDFCKCDEARERQEAAA